MLNNDYILRSDAVEAMMTCRSLTGVAKLEAVNHIMPIPAADVEPVRHGRWIPGKAVYSEYNEGRLVARYYDQWTCGVCNYLINDQHYSRISYKRCPECGAHMDAELPKEEENAE